jgi:hypothetical protein
MNTQKKSVMQHPLRVRFNEFAGKPMEAPLVGQL